MEPSLYKDFTTSRGIEYHYFFSKPSDGKPYLVFLHGFPSDSKDWAAQAAFFGAKGYGLVIPDLLGYGGTDKPGDVAAYVMSLMAKDIVELLESENAFPAIPVGHDWGSGLCSTIATRYQDRFKAFANIAVSYIPPAPDFDFEKMLATTKSMFGYELYGYWEFFNREAAAKDLIAHFDSFYSLIFPDDPTIWSKNFAPLGALEDWITTDKTSPISKFVPENDKEARKELMVDSNFAGLNWYRASVRGLAAQDSATIPKEQYVISKPVFFGAALKDMICRADIQKASTAALCPNATVVDFDTSHWVMFEEPDRLNAELLKWIESTG